MDDGPTVPPPAPETRMAAVWVVDVMLDAGRWRKPGTAPPKTSSTLMERGWTMHGLLECGAWKSPRKSFRFAGLGGVLGSEVLDESEVGWGTIFFFWGEVSERGGESLERQCLGVLLGVCVILELATAFT